MALDLSKHPCFSENTRHQTGRIHLPVAPKCNVQCNYCNRKFDCANESRPGVTSAVLSPRQALTYLERARERMPNLAVAGIAGPGDPFATPDTTLETLRLVRERFPEILLCVASNGLNVANYAAELARLQVSHITFTVNAVDPAIGARIYAWVRDERVIYRGDSAACVLLQRQRRAIRELKKHGVVVKINTIIVPGVNECHIEEIAREMAGLGADVMNCIPLYPVADTPFERYGTPSVTQTASLRSVAAQYLPQMSHCTRCRADAVGLLGEPQSPQFTNLLQNCATGAAEADPARPYVAVASMEGVLVNQHLGEASRLWIFAPEGEGIRLIETRETPEAGQGSLRWREMAELLKDCRAVVTSGAGKTPRRILEQEGLPVIEMGGLIADGLAALFQTGEVPAPLRRQMKFCGTECRGGGMGCA